MGADRHTEWKDYAVWGSIGCILGASWVKDGISWIVNKGYVT